MVAVSNIGELVKYIKGQSSFIGTVPVRAVAQVGTQGAEGYRAAVEAADAALHADLEFANTMFGASYANRMKNAGKLLEYKGYDLGMGGSVGLLSQMLDTKLDVTDTIKFSNEPLASGKGILDKAIKSNMKLLQKDANKLSDGIRNALREHKEGFRLLNEQYSKLHEDVAKQFQAYIKTAPEAEQIAASKRWKEVATLINEQFAEKIHAHEEAVNSMKNIVERLSENGIKLKHTFDFNLGSRAITEGAESAVIRTADETALKATEHTAPAAGGNGLRTGLAVGGGAVLGYMLGNAIDDEEGFTMKKGATTVGGGLIGYLVSTFMGGTSSNKAAMKTFPEVFERGAGAISHHMPL